MYKSISFFIGTPNYLIKLNIKGLELEVLTDLIHSGALQHLDYIYVDFHSWMNKDHKSFRYLILFIHTYSVYKHFCDSVTIFDTGQSDIIDHYFSVNLNKGEGAKKYGIYNIFYF